MDTTANREHNTLINSKTPSVFGGIMIIAGTAVGAGMFSMPTVSSGMWFSWSLACLLLTWFCMYHSSLLILETNLNYPAGASFDTFVKDTLGPRWNYVNGFTLAFVLYILTYAYISGAGSMINHTLESTLGAAPPAIFTGLAFTLTLAVVVWFSTQWVSRLTSILIGGMILTFLMSVSDLTASVSLSVLFETDDKATYYPYVFAALPFFVATFGFHGTVPSLVKFYGKEPLKIKQCLFYGSLISLSIYLLWQTSTLGNIPRHEFIQILADGGNIGALIGSLSDVVNGPLIHGLLNTFAIFAVISSFLGVTLGLFDYVADLLNFDNSGLGRLKTALVTFAPPTFAGLVFPDGFLYAISFAGLAATLWALIIPALAARESRRKFGNPLFRVRGGSGFLYFLILFGIIIAVCQILAIFGQLPVLK